MMPETATDIKLIQNRIFIIRGRPVVMDKDLAGLYGVTTSVLNQTVKRNLDRFPDEFSFVITKEELTKKLSQIVTASTSAKSTQRFRNIRKLPRVFTEHGALMASTILRSDEAKAMSLFIIRAFIEMREALTTNQKILKRLAEIDKSLLQHDQALWDLYQKLLPLLQATPEKPKKRIGFQT